MWEKISKRSADTREKNREVLADVRKNQEVVGWCGKRENQKRFYDLKIIGKAVCAVIHLSMKQPVILIFIIVMFINRDGWDNAEKVSKAHVGKEKHFSSSRIVGRSEWQPPKLSQTISIVDVDVTYQLCREPWPLWMLVCDSDLKWRCGLTRVWTAKRPNARPASLK